MPERPADQFTRDHLKRKLPEIEDPLFAMTDGILRDAELRDWNLLVCDDTNGRLPTYFVRKALERVRGKRTPTMFLNGSTAMRARLDKGDYIEYLQSRLDPAREYRPLIVTESVGTGEAVTYLKSVLEDSIACEFVDAASVATRPRTPEFVRYVGSREKADLLDVNLCLETIAASSLKARTLTKARRLIPQSIKDALPQRLHTVGRPTIDGNVLTGLYTAENPIIPVSESDRTHRIGVAYGVLDRVLDDYVALSKATELSTPSSTSVILEGNETIQSERDRAEVADVLGR